MAARDQNVDNDSLILPTSEHDLFSPIMFSVGAYLSSVKDTPLVCFRMHNFAQVFALLCLKRLKAPFGKAKAYALGNALTYFGTRCPKKTSGLGHKRKFIQYN
jgi:hypothetical protein